MKLKRIKRGDQEIIRVVCDVCGCDVFAFENDKTFCANCGKEQHEEQIIDVDDLKDEKEENGIPVEPDKCDICGGELVPEGCDVCGWEVSIVYRGKLICEKCGKVRDDLIQAVLDNL